MLSKSSIFIMVCFLLLSPALSNALMPFRGEVPTSGSIIQSDLTAPLFTQTWDDLPNIKKVLQDALPDLLINVTNDWIPKDLPLERRRSMIRIQLRDLQVTSATLVCLSGQNPAAMAMVISWDRCMVPACAILRKVDSEIIAYYFPAGTIEGAANDFHVAIWHDFTSTARAQTIFLPTIYQYDSGKFQPHNERFQEFFRKYLMKHEQLLASAEKTPPEDQSELRIRLRDLGIADIHVAIIYARQVLGEKNFGLDKAEAWYRSPDENLRRNAALIYAMIKDANSIARLKALASDKSYDVAYTAKDALAR